MMQVAIINYNAGNIQSVVNALRRIDVEGFVTDEAVAIRNADKVIFPGVGHATPAMQYLKERKLDELIISLKQPVLGICLGMQLMCAHSEEGDTDCIGIFDTAVKRFSSGVLKVPQVGWNDIFGYASPLFNGLKEYDFMYCVHSYYAELSGDTVATAEYGLPYSAALQNNNFYAVQFHPEKSGTAGEQILRNFIALI